MVYGKYQHFFVLYEIFSVLYMYTIHYTIMAHFQVIIGYFTTPTRVSSGYTSFPRLISSRLAILRGKGVRI